LSQRLQRLREKQRRLEQEERLKQKPLQLPNDPVAFCREVLNFHPFFYQETLLTDPSDRIAVRLCRQSGKTTTLGAIAIWYCATNPNKLVLIVAPDLRQSMVVMDRIEGHLARIDSNILSKIIERQQRTKIQFTNGSMIIALPCSENLLRGYTANLIIADEAAFFEHDEHMFNAVLLPMLFTTKGRMIISSTPWSSKSMFWRYTKGDLSTRFSQHHSGWEALVQAGLITQQQIEDFKASGERAPFL